MGGKLVLSVINNYLQNTHKPTRQNEDEATYTERFAKKDGYINIALPPKPEELNRKIRAFFPWPTVWTEVQVHSVKGKVNSLKLKLLPNHEPSTMNHQPFLIQPEGKKPLTIKEFKNGYPHIYKQIENLLS